MVIYLDEIDHQAIVIDIGTTSIKFGYAGELYPRFIAQTRIKEKFDNLDKENSEQNQRGAKISFLTSISELRISDFSENDLSSMNLITLIDNNYAITNFCLFEELVDYYIRKKMLCDPTQHPILICDSACVVKNQRNKISEIFFEKFGVPAVYFTHNCILSSFAFGKVTSFVLDIAENSTIFAPILDGYILKQLMVRSPLSGQLIKNCLRSTFDSLNLDYSPKCLVNVISTNSNCTKTNSFQQILDSLVHEELNRFMESMLEVSPESIQKKTNEGDRKSFFPNPLKYDFLNSKTSYTFGKERFLIPEILFDTTQIMQFENVESNVYDKTNQLQLGNIPQLVFSVLENSGTDLRNIFANNFTLVGGISLMRKFRNRFNTETNKMAGINLLKVNQLPQISQISNSSSSQMISNNQTGFSSEEIRHSSWTGGSMLASINHFNKIWTTKLEYDERKLNQDE